MVGIAVGVNLTGGKNMPAMKRNKTKYPGVYFINGKRNSGKGDEKIFYIMYRKEGKRIEEKAASVTNVRFSLGKKKDGELELRMTAG